MLKISRRCPSLQFMAAIAILLAAAAGSAAAGDNMPPALLRADALKHYVDTFNADDEELYANAVPNERAWAFLEANIPLFECPDEDIERTYYFRWWTYRKHIRDTPDGWVITEFLPTVPWSGKHNTISCPAGHHFYEGRWLHDSRYLNDYALFWFRKGGNPRLYSFWAADAIYAYYLVKHDESLVVDLLDDLVGNYEQWERSRRTPDGLFWQIDDRDGMEVSIGKSGKRATINSYMYGDAMAIAKIAEMAGRPEIAQTYRDKAARLRRLVQEKLWDDQAKFFKVLPRDGHAELVGVRELHGYTPWYFNLPASNEGYEVAWKQLMDPEGFYAPFGPTTAEQRHPDFQISYQGHGCQWNGPSWPLSTSVTLTAMANVLNNYEQDVIGRKDYFQMLKIYTRSHRRTLEDGRVVPWIDENLNPYSGEWIARRRCEEQNAELKKQGREDRMIVERGKDYNHSSYCDLIITGLVGLRPRPDDTVEVNPLVPQGKWAWFCLDRVAYHGHMLTILWDETGKKYGKGKGLRVFADGRQIARADTLCRVQGILEPMVAADR
jgi:hypothetical protein